MPPRRSGAPFRRRVRHAPPRLPLRPLRRRRAVRRPRRRRREDHSVPRRHALLPPRTGSPSRKRHSCRFTPQPLVHPLLPLRRVRRDGGRDPCAARAASGRVPARDAPVQGGRRVRGRHARTGGTHGGRLGSARRARPRGCCGAAGRHRGARRLLRRRRGEGEDEGVGLAFHVGAVASSGPPQAHRPPPRAPHGGLRGERHVLLARGRGHDRCRACPRRAQRSHALLRASVFGIFPLQPLRHGTRNILRRGPCAACRPPSIPCGSDWL